MNVRNNLKIHTSRTFILLQTICKISEQRLTLCTLNSNMTFTLPKVKWETPLYHNITKSLSGERNGRFKKRIKIRCDLQSCDNKGANAKALEKKWILVSCDFLCTAKTVAAFFQFKHGWSETLADEIGEDRGVELARFGGVRRDGADRAPAGPTSFHFSEWTNLRALAGNDTSVFHHGFLLTSVPPAQNSSRN